MKTTTINRRLALFVALIMALTLWTAMPLMASADDAVIDVSQEIPPSSGAGWTYADNVYTITNGANVTISAGTNTKRIEVAENATVAITLDDASIISSDNSPLKLLDGAKATVILSGANTLTAGEGYAGLNAPEGTTVTITSISGNGSTESSITATGGEDAAGIGGGSNGGGGAININGGEINALGGAGGAGIGGGYYGSGGAITITGGNVIATSVDYGPGIGSGYNYGNTEEIDGGTITISGGTIAATGKRYSAGIGGGGYTNVGSVIEITGGDITATGGAYSAGIGGGYHSNTNMADFGTITITGGTIEANAGDGDGPAGIGGGMNTIGGVIEITGGAITATGKIGGPGIGSGALGSTSTKFENSGCFIKIAGGTINALGGKTGGAGIGGGANSSSGSIEITGGTIDATGGSYAASIGGGLRGRGWDITISGGMITAFIPTSDGSGIGAGYQNWNYEGSYDGKTGSITISGGTIVIYATAAGSVYAIGHHVNAELENKSYDTIDISGGTIIAYGTQSTVKIGGPYSMEVSITGTPVIIVPEIHDYTDDPEDETSSIVTGDGFTIDTGSKTITLERDVTISEGATFTIPPDWTLDVNGHNFINAGTTVNLGDVVDGENVDGNGAYTVPGTVYTSTPVMSVAPSGTYHFTTRAEGYSAQTAVTFTITNTSENAGALIGLDAQLIGAGANDFILTKTGLGTTLAAEAQAVVTVVPNTGLGIGIHTATLSISSANGNTVNVGLSFEVATPYMLTVVKGIGSGPYAAGEQVEITANSIQGKVFDKWTTSDVTLGNANSTTTTFIMPANEVTVTANYKDVPAAQTYPVTVTGGSGSGDYAENAVVTITANAPAGGKVFDEWTSDDVTFANPNSAQTSFTMPDKAVTVTANYRDDPNGGGDDPNPPVNPPETDDGWVYDDGVWKYYIDGEAVTGWTHDGKAWYYFDSAGVMKTGWLYDQNYKAWFYLGGNGAMKTGWVKDDGAWYYLRGDGKMVAGKWLHDTDDSWYYLSGNGKMLTGKQTIGGKVYSFKTDGVWVS